jgi:uncharacterized membrane protein
MFIRLYLLLPLALVLASLHALPFLPRPDRLFGIAVPREIRQGSEGRQLLRRYQWRLLPWTAAALLASFWLPLAWVVAWAALAPLIPLAAAGVSFSRGRAAAKPFALAAPSTRAALLTDSGPRISRSLLPFLVPLALLAGTALYLRSQWDRIPARFPVHWGNNGVPNGWATRSFGGVYGPLIFGALIVLFMAGIYAATVCGSRRSTQQPFGQVVVLSVAWLIGAAFSGVGFLPLDRVPTGGIAAVSIAYLACLAASIRALFSHRAGAGMPDGEITPDDCWHGDQFYSNPADPALFVEKRVGLGWTLNFGNRLSWVFLALAIAIPAGLVFLAFRFTKQN